MTNIINSLKENDYSCMGMLINLDLNFKTRLYATITGSTVSIVCDQTINYYKPLLQSSLILLNLANKIKELALKT